MALEITELLITKLKLLCGKETSSPSSATQVTQFVGELEQFKESLKGAEETNNQNVDAWEKLLQEIYSLEDKIETLLSKTTTLQSKILLKPLFHVKIWQLRGKLKKFHGSSNLDGVQDQPKTYSSDSEELETQLTCPDDMQQVPKEDSSIEPEETYSSDTEELETQLTCSEDMQQVPREDSSIEPEEVTPVIRKVSSNLKDSDRQGPTSSVAVAVALSEEDAHIPATVTDASNKLEDFQVPSREISTNPEDLQASPRLRRTYPVDAQLPLRKLILKNSSFKQFLTQEIDDYATEPNASDEICEETCDNSEEKSVEVNFEDLVNKLAQPVLSQRKLQSLMLKAEVSCSGKAILLWTVFNAESVRQHFQFRAWIDVSEVSTEIDTVIKAICQNAITAKEEEATIPSSGQGLHDFLVWRRFLIVLYGVQPGFDWDNLKSVFPHSLNGSRVILAVSHTNGSKSLANSSGYLEEDSSVNSAKAIIDELTESILSPRRLLFLISIVGVVGSDKKNLLWPMYNAEDVKQHFDCRAWICVPKVSDQDDILAKILEQITNIKMYKRPNRKVLQQRLRSFLTKKRYLVVLYDVWTAGIWDKLKVSFPNSLNGSRVILAVHGVDVARKTNSWIFRITPGKELLHDLTDMQENTSSGKDVKRWDNRLAVIKDETSDMVGLEDKLKEAAELTLNNYDIHFLISVLGVAGSGKTTLVRTFYNSIATKQHFECRAWISVPQDFDERDILLDLFRQLRKAKEKQSLSLEQLRVGIRHFLTWKRYLIVLDDVRSSKIWETLNLDFPNSLSGSKVILTTRNTYLARHISTRATGVIQQRLLTEKESWDLFLKKVQTSKIMQEDANNPRLLSFKNKIWQRCRGLPLQIVVLGGLLSTKENYDEWSKVIEQTSQKREKKKGVQDEDQLNSSGQLVSAETKQTNNKKNKAEVQLGSSKGKKIADDNQSSSLAQLSSPGTQQKEEDKKTQVTEPATFGEDQSSSFPEQPPSVTRRKEEKRKAVQADATAGEDEEKSPNHLSSSGNEQKDEKTNFGTKVSAGEGQSSSSDELSSLAEMSSPDILAISYQDLETPLKWCLLYMGLFPDAYQIPTRRLLQLWLAEGLVTVESNERTPLEEAKHYLEELEKRGMIETTEQRLDGSPKKCCVPNALREKLFPTAQKVGFFHFHRGSGTSQSPHTTTVRRLAESVDMFIDTNPQENCFIHLRSYISFYNKRGDAPASGVSELLNRIVERGSGMLVVLDLEGVYKPVLSETLGKLPFLKYLGLRKTLLDSIPESVGDLPHLETLDIKHTYIINLPSTIWQAKKLQHLYMSEIYVDVSIQKPSASGSLNNSQICVPIGKPSASGILNNLQTLWGLIIRGKIPERNWLNRVVGLRKLKLTCHEASIPVIAKWLSKLKNLQSLKLRSITELNEPGSLELGVVMTELKNLSKLYLLGRLPNPINVSELPERLEILTLSVSHLSVDPMEMLGKLEELKVLKLYARSYQGEYMTCHPNGFPQLRVLKLWMLKELQNWTVDQTAMQNLKEVEIRCCKKLAKVEGLEKLPTLRNLILTNMERKFVDDVKERMGSKVGSQVAVMEQDMELAPQWLVEESDAALEG